MLSQDKIRTDKKGVSVLIGYVLLIVFAVIIASLVFVWLKSYVPAEALKCPDGVSVFVSELTFDNTTRELNMSLKNNGRFDVAGYFIHAKNNASQEIADKDLSAYVNQNFSARKFGNSVIIEENNISFTEGGNLFKPGDQKRNIFNVPWQLGDIYSVTIIPTRFQEENNKQRFVSCSEAKVQQIVGEPTVCVPETCSSLNYSCGAWNDGCGNQINCGNCTGTNICSSGGQCIPPAQCTDTCATYGYECGTWQVCGASTTCGNFNGSCQSGFNCDTWGHCVPNCGNRVIDSGEQCDDGNLINGDGCSSSCVIESGFSCVGEPSVCNAIVSCPSYCVSIGKGSGSCDSSPACPHTPGGNYSSGGDVWCTGGTQADSCCCF